MDEIIHIQMIENHIYQGKLGFVIVEQKSMRRVMKIENRDKYEFDISYMLYGEIDRDFEA